MPLKNLYLHPPEKARCVCGAEFIRYHVSQRYHDGRCGGARLTDEDKRIIAEFRNLCKKYHLSIQKTFEYISGRNWRMFYMLEERVGKGNFNAGWFRTETKDRFISVLKKFNDDLRSGWYEIIPTGKVGMGFLSSWGRCFKAERRLSPGRPECPMKYTHCQGGIMPGDCPRHNRECSLYATGS